MCTGAILIYQSASILMTCLRAHCSFDLEYVAHRGYRLPCKESTLHSKVDKSPEMKLRSACDDQLFVNRTQPRTTESGRRPVVRTSQFQRSKLSHNIRILGLKAYTR